MRKSAEKSKQPVSMGYPNLEALLEQKTPDLSNMLANHQQLADLSQAKSGTPKEKAAAKSAALAYEQFFELFSTLLQVKQKMIDEKTVPQKGGAKKK